MHRFSWSMSLYSLCKEVSDLYEMQNSTHSILSRFASLGGTLVGHHTRGSAIADNVAASAGQGSSAGQGGARIKCGTRITTSPGTSLPISIVSSTAHPEIAEQLKRDPSLVNDQKFAADHPALQQFLADHPEVREQYKENPNAFMRQENRFDRSEDNQRPRNRSARTSQPGPLPRRPSGNRRAAQARSIAGQ